MLRLVAGRHVSRRYRGRGLAHLPPVEVYRRAYSMNPRDAVLAAWLKQDEEMRQAKREAMLREEKARHEALLAEEKARWEAHQAQKEAEKARREAKRIAELATPEGRLKAEQRAQKALRKKQKKLESRKRARMFLKEEKDKAKEKRKAAEEEQKRLEAAKLETKRRRAEQQAKKAERRKEIREALQRTSPHEVRPGVFKAPRRAVIIPKPTTPAWLDRSKGGYINYRRLKEIQEEQSLARKRARLENLQRRALEVAEENEQARVRRELMTRKKLEEAQIKSIHLKRSKWLFKGIVGASLHDKGNAKALQHIFYNEMEPSTKAVTSSIGIEVLFGYNKNEGSATIQVPGLPPVLLPNVRYPLTVTPNTSSGRQRLFPKKFYDIVFEAASLSGRDLNLRGLHIVATRSVLQVLFQCAAGTLPASYWARLDMHIVKNTVFLQRPSREYSEEDGLAVMEARGPNWGHTFEEAVTKRLSPYENGGSYLHMLRYHIGDHDCAVLAEVDACKKKPAPLANPKEWPGASTIMKEGMTFKRHRTRPMSIELAVEIKTAAVADGVGQRHFNTMLEFSANHAWFGRTPWLMLAQHTDGKFKGHRMIDTKDLIIGFEQRHQTALRKLDRLLSILREEALRHKGESLCLHVHPDSIKIFALTEHDPPISRQYVDEFWQYKSLAQWKQERNANAKAQAAEAEAQRAEGERAKAELQQKFGARTFKGW
ncbi:geranylgeranyl pyrophosphate synthetase [Colletotrichum plurivorum]|uniref:Geranylgeranyl pyrophosphate synthetase n=1 Tax=Colletotrichum plurivorum TaxID=2175906 RepID=A0A8H6KJI8_9PEZI|nr:geranylgeranyl pyrophosphate synthetase [Colletotrichum plurivorum]